MSVVIIIPARYASSRFPGKPLVELTGSDGIPKTLIQRTWETATSVSGISDIFVATDDDRIAAKVHEFGGKVIMTSETCANGTERCAEALDSLDRVPDLIVNLQGDAPLTPPWFLEDLIEAMSARSDMSVATPVLRCDHQTYSHFKDDRAAGRVGGTTAVFARDGSALYFSKEVLPYLPEGKDVEPLPVFHHVGVYAYRPAALGRYSGWTEGPLEANEGLEQLRFLENGEAILCVEVDARGRLFWELNNPVDVARIEEVL
ncbi:3-deoxy-manno-octulosonate cytidylyltransferase [Rhizorhapis sp. SPR117]|uniref:3-deoxy-manno-octulosonate cytidylyltransferase n=1 Tax=Rhizorhapis sp. SPR117 TaxID=2912611 RepID=UPI001F43D09A|nr:3-deoxy-manno-octulosonate cytidylyltransferase [Rhizorhapis sp. SPR117]